MTPRVASVVRRFRDHVLDEGRLREGDGVVVALSGGADSVALLHLFRFTDGLPAIRLEAAHLDHAMRDASAGDALWVRGLCRAWDVPLHLQLLDSPPASEAEARRHRYAFLEGVRGGRDARWVVTAHHADDQAETVLFRAARGTGLRGLRGIRAVRAPGIWRPLLPFTRAELRRYAAARELAWREDATNVQPMARNILRHEILPALERGVAPAATKALAGLARRAEADDAAWRSLEPTLLEGAGLRREGPDLSLDRTAMLALHPEVRGRLIRAVARRLGVRVGAAGTRRAVAFTSSGLSGSAVPVAGGLTLSRELDRYVLSHPSAVPPDVWVTVDSGEEGTADAVVGGSSYHVRWGRGVTDVAPWVERFSLPDLTFPLTVRGWRPGDRIRLPYGSKKVKKLLLEARIPSARRRKVAVLADGAGAVLWVPGVMRSSDARPPEDGDVLTIGIMHAQPD